MARQIGAASTVLAAAFPSLRDLIVGGGMVETFAFGGPPPADQSHAGLTKLRPPGRPLSLDAAVALSSNFFAANIHEFSAQHIGYWGIGHNSKQNDFTVWDVGDGGLLDNNAMLAMIQRGVEKFVWSIPTGIDFVTDPDFCNQSALGAGFNKNGGWISDDIADKFGLGNCTGGFYRCHNKVFDEEDYLPLLCEMKKVYSCSQNLCRPLVLRQKLKVVENKYYQVKGGQTMDILIVDSVISRCPGGSA